MKKSIIPHRFYFHTGPPRVSYHVEKTRGDADELMLRNRNLIGCEIYAKEALALASKMLLITFSTIR